VAVNKLYLVNFDYTIDTEKKTIMDVKFVKNEDEEMLLLVVLESGEVGTYSLFFGASKSKGSLLDVFASDDFDLITLFILILVVGAFLVVRLARSVRINVNIRRQR